VRRVPAPSRRDGVRWWLDRHRRSVGAVCAAIAVWAGLASIHHGAPRSVAVLVAARDLPPGAVVRPDDLRTVGLRPDAVPPSALRPGASVVGQAVAVAVPAGLPLTRAALSVGRVLPTGTEAVPVRLADPGAAALLRTGDRVDVLVAHGDGATAADIAPADGGAASAAPAADATVVAGDLAVLSVPPPLTGTGDQGGLVVVAATADQATALARAAAGGRLSVTVRRS
jgi:Flp pilus assembly protein CpaB